MIYANWFIYLRYLFSQVSGVATVFEPWKPVLEKQGTLFIFTTTDKDVNRYEDWQIIRIPSVPFFAFKDRRFAYREFNKSWNYLNNISWILIHTRTNFLLACWEFGLRVKWGSSHPYLSHQYEELCALWRQRGCLIQSSTGQSIWSRRFLHDVDGVIYPSEIVRDFAIWLSGQGWEKQVIPLGLN